MQTYKFLSFFCLSLPQKNIKSVYHGIIIIFIRKSKSDANEQEKQDKKNFDILKYDGIRARNMGKLPYAIKCFEEAVALQEEKETLGLLASAYLQANRTEDARITLDRLIAKMRQTYRPCCLWPVYAIYKKTMKGWIRPARKPSLWMRRTLRLTT